MNNQHTGRKPGRETMEATKAIAREANKQAQKVSGALAVSCNDAQTNHEQQLYFAFTWTAFRID